ncbi:hypothetical protein CPB84DRAFT_1848819 [Gymnopilus junonius]|uniref:Uncharacterized protein n=1 Tax=Gymnopilus junonius TaxID=109634 RepID=A0A9P5NLX9_GYMJU|nr:hypothetical protein CPB84DRAFT_1848819 [Gymnopilus junonius]
MHQNSIPQADKAPLLLTCVLSRWWSVTLASPWLWAKLYISFCNDYHAPMPFPHTLPGSVPGGGAQSAEVDLHQKKAFQALTHQLWGPHDLEGSYHPEDPTTQLFQTLLLHTPYLHSLELIMPLEIYHQLDKVMSSSSSSLLPLEGVANVHADLLALQVSRSQNESI